jgi:hypothetical protein
MKFNNSVKRQNTQQFASLPEIHVANSGTGDDSAVQPVQGDILGHFKHQPQKYEVIIHGTLAVIGLIIMQECR